MAQNLCTLQLSDGSWGNGTVVTCYDMGGRRMFRVMPEPGACTLDVNTSQWGSGEYLLNISGATINSSFKIVVNR